MAEERKANEYKEVKTDQKIPAQSMSYTPFYGIDDLCKLRENKIKERLKER